jgi:hypothetical protein
MVLNFLGINIFAYLTEALPPNPPKNPAVRDAIMRHMAGRQTVVRLRSSIPTDSVERTRRADMPAGKGEILVGI